jgi:dCTP deaminase
MRERFLRLLHGLEELRRNPDPGVRALVDAAGTEIRRDLQSFETSVGEILQDGEFEQSPDDPDGWSVPYQGRWSDATAHGMRRLETQQRKIVQYLLLPSSPPSDIGFFLARGLDLSPTRASHRERFALSYSRFLVWETFGVGSSQAVPAVPVPFAETLTPLRWPLLLHELGHHLLPAPDDSRRKGNDLVRNVVRDRLGPDAKAGARKDLQEVLADRVAERTCGTAYVLALLREFHLISMIGHQTDLHVAPPLLSRLRVLDSWPDLESALPGPWRARLEEEDVRDLAWERSVAVELIPDAAAPRPHVVDEAVRLLRLGEPAGSVRSLPAPTQGELLACARGASDVDPVEVFASAAEVACTDAEILEAAWKLEACMPARDYLARLRDSLLTGTALDLDKTGDATRFRARRDTNISRSLQAAAVHRFLVDWDTKIADRTAGARQVGDSPCDSTSDAGRAETDGATPSLVAEIPESAPLGDVHLLRRLTHEDAFRLVVRPLIDPAQIGGTTIDLRLGTEWEALRTSRFAALSPADDTDDVVTLLDASVERFRLTSGQNQGLVLHPGELMLALTLEYLSLPPDLWGNLEGRSTWARIGLQVHASAGMVDAGFDGYLTLELQNTGRLPLVLFPGLRVAQMAFFPVKGVSRYYRRKPGAAYSDQTTARTAFPSQHEHEALRAHQAFERDAHRKDREAQRRLAAAEPPPGSDDGA